MERFAERHNWVTGGGNPGGPVDLSQDPAEGPRQPQLKSYLCWTFGSQLTLRNFSHLWFKQYLWLEYLVSVDASFCYACRHFFHHARGHTKKSFTHCGFRKWRKGAGFAKHNVSASHKLAMVGWCEFKERVRSGSRILKKLDAGHDKIVQENRHYMRAVVESLQFTACQTNREESEKMNSPPTFLVAPKEVILLNR